MNPLDTPRRAPKFFAFLMAVVTAGCGGATNEAPAEELAEESQAYQGPLCASDSGTNCWTQESTNYGAFDFARDIACMANGTHPSPPDDSTRLIHCRLPKRGESAVIAYSDPGGRLPVGTKSIAIHAFSLTNNYVLALGKDNLLRAVQGDTTKTIQDGTNFARSFVYVNNLDNTGATLCLAKVVSALMPSRYEVRRMILGLTCDGALKYVDITARWANIASSPAMRNVPAGPWADISHDDLWGGFTIMRRNGELWRAAFGSVDLNNNTTWSDAIKLPPLPVTSAGQQLLPTAVGGAYVITNAGTAIQCPYDGSGCQGDDHRFYRYELRSRTWQRLNHGTPFVPRSFGDLWSGSNNAYPYFRGLIVDASAYKWKDQAFGVYHVFGRMYAWQP